MIRLSLIAFLIFFNTFSVNANHVPETLFGIKINETLSFQDITQHIHEKNYKKKGEEWVFNESSLEKIFEGYDLFKPNPMFYEFRVTTDENKIVKSIWGMHGKFKDADEFKKTESECSDKKNELKKILETKHNIKFKNKILTETNSSGILYIDYDYITHKGQNVRMSLGCQYYSKNYFRMNKNDKIAIDNVAYVLDIFLDTGEEKVWVDTVETDFIDFDILYSDSSGL